MRNGFVLAVVTIMFTLIFLLWGAYVLYGRGACRPVFRFRLGDADEPNYGPRVIPGFVSREEIAKILSTSQKRGFAKSLVGNDAEDLSTRKSMTCWLDPTEHPWLQDIYTRVRSIPELAEDQATNSSRYEYEQCQVVRYEPGGFYEEHYDQCHTDEAYCARQVAQFGGPRKWTLIIYLTDDFDGGETYFNKMKLGIRPSAGDAILFHGLTSDNQYVHPLSLHQGRPVLRGEKYIANIWVHHDQGLR